MGLGFRGMALGLGFRTYGLEPQSFISVTLAGGHSRHRD